MICIALFAYLFFAVFASVASLYNIKEVRDVLYEPAITSTIAGIDPSLDLSELKSENVDFFRERLMSKYPSTDDPAYIFPTSVSGQRFACSLPKVTDKADDDVYESYNPKYLAEIIAASFYVKNCIKLDNGWWNYELCKGKTIRQFHGAKNEATKAENSLGMFTGQFKLPDFQKSTADRHLYVEELYQGGTPCDVPDKTTPRKSFVRYECDPLLATSEAYMHQVEEVSSCEYVIRVKVGSLCKLKPFAPPSKNDALKITCQPFVSIEKINQYLEEKILENQTKLRAQESIIELRMRLLSIKRCRSAMMRTKLDRHGKKHQLIMDRLNDEFSHFSSKYFIATYEAVNGRLPDASSRDNLAKLAQLVDGPELANFDYTSDEDEDRGNLWYYFKDPYWNKSYFPRSLRYVDISNEYYERIRRDLTIFEPDVRDGIAEFMKMSGDPFNPKENLLIAREQMAPILLDYLPDYIPANRVEHFEFGALLEKFVTGEGVFGGLEKETIERWIEQLRDEDWPDNWVWPEKHTVAKIQADFLAPCYVLVELFVESGFDTLQNVKKDYTTILDKSARMLDRLVVAYDFAGIKYRAEIKNRGKSLKDRENTKNSEFWKYYATVLEKRSESEHAQLMLVYRKIMSRAISRTRQMIFDELWQPLSSDLLRLRRAKNKEKRERAQRLQNLLGTTSFGQVVSEIDQVTSASLLELLSSAGLSNSELKIEVVSLEDIDDTDASAIIETQMEEIRSAQKLKDQDDAYRTVIETEVND